MGIVAFLAEVKVKTVLAFVPDIFDGHLTTSITFNYLLHSLSGLHDYFYAMSRGVMPSYLQTLIGSCKVAVLTQTEVWAVRTHKASTNDWFHVTTHAFVLAVCSQAIR